MDFKETLSNLLREDTKITIQIRISQCSTCSRYTTRSCDQILLTYPYKSLIVEDVMNAVKLLSSFEVQNSDYVYSDGTIDKLFTLRGGVPVYRPEFMGVRRNIPVSLYLQKNFPYCAPICLVTPEKDQEVIKTDYVSTNCTILLPYLRDWQKPGCDLRSLLEVMISAFSDEIPLIFSEGDVVDNISELPLSDSTSPAACENASAYKKFFSKSREAFTCCLCEDIIKPPAVLAPCCGQIIGCNECVQRMNDTGWDKRCPLCRQKVKEMKTIKGLDEFFLGLIDSP